MTLPKPPSKTDFNLERIYVILDGLLQKTEAIQKILQAILEEKQEECNEEDISEEMEEDDEQDTDPEEWPAGCPKSETAIP
jgi:hypothetical protein